MKRYFLILTLTLMLLCGCHGQRQPAQIVATTLPVYDLTQRLCQGTELNCQRLITDSVSCLHDYTLQVSQMRLIESAELVVLSGAGLEDFLADALSSCQNIADASAGVELLHAESHSHDHDHEHACSYDPHIWLDPANAGIMAENICNALSSQYPQHRGAFEENLAKLQQELLAVSQYAATQLAGIRTRQLITFHDGFSYLAQAYGLEIVHAIEEESGSEASAAELIEILELMETHHLQAVFTERYGSASAASIVAAETGSRVYQLDMAMAGDSYFDAMYHNIDTLKEALE